MVDDNGRDDSAANGNGGNGGDSSADLDAQIRELTAKKQAAATREAQRRESMNDDDFASSKPKEPGKFDGEVREPGWRWDQRQNDWFEHRGTDLTKRANAGQLPYNFTHLGDGSPERPHRIEHEQRWM